MATATPVCLEGAEDLAYYVASRCSQAARGRALDVLVAAWARTLAQERVEDVFFAVVDDLTDPALDALAVKLDAPASGSELRCQLLALFGRTGGRRELLRIVAQAAARDLDHRGRSLEDVIAPICEALPRDEDARVCNELLSVFCADQYSRN